MYNSEKQIDTRINYPVLKYASHESNIDFRAIEKMLNEKDHNKFTTTYFLLLKKAQRGELEEELKKYTVSCQDNNISSLGASIIKDEINMITTNTTETYYRDNSRDSQKNKDSGKNHHRDTTEKHHRDHSRDTTEKHREHSRDTAEKHREHSRDTADKHREHSRDTADKYRDQSRDSTLKRQRDHSKDSNDKDYNNYSKDSGKNNKREFSNRKTSADKTYNNFDRTKTSNQNESVNKSKSATKKSFLDESKISAKKNHAHPENLEKTRNSSQNRSSNRNKNIMNNMEIMNIIEKYEDKENIDKPRERKLVEREKITEREKWFSLDKTIKVKEKIVEKEKFDNEVIQNVSKVDKLHLSQMVDTDRNSSFPTPKREPSHSSNTQQPIINMNHYNAMSKKLENKVIELKNGDIQEFPIIKKATPNNTAMNFYNTSGSNKKFADAHNNQENKLGLELRRKSSNNSYTTWVNKTTGANNPMPVNFDKRNFSLDSNRNNPNLNVSPIRLDRGMQEKYTHRISFDKRKVSGHLSTDNQSNKSQEYNYADRHGSGTKAISKVLKKIIDKHVPSKQIVKSMMNNTMNNTFNRSDKREDRSPDNDRLQIFCSRHDSIDLNNLTSYPRSNNNISNGPNTTKVFRTLDGNGMISSKSGFRTIQKNMPTSNRGNRSVISKDKNNYLMNTYTTKSPHPIKTAKNGAQTMKMDHSKLFSSLDDRNSTNYQTINQKKSESSQRTKGLELTQNNNRIKINNLT